MVTSTGMPDMFCLMDAIPINAVLQRGARVYKAEPTPWWQGTSAATAALN